MGAFSDGRCRGAPRREVLRPGQLDVAGGLPEDQPARHRRRPGSCRARGARLVFPSSYLYGDAGHQPIAEDATLVAKNPYALSKKLAEEACQFFADRSGVRVTILRPFNIYGPGQSGTFLVPTIATQLETGNEVHVKDLEPRRDYVYVLDVVEAMVKAVVSERGFRVFNLGSGASYSVADLIQTMQDVWGTNLPVRSDWVRRQDKRSWTRSLISGAPSRRWVGSQGSPCGRASSTSTALHEDPADRSAASAGDGALDGLASARRGSRGRARDGGGESQHRQSP